MGLLLAGAIALVVLKTGPAKPAAVTAGDAGADGDAAALVSADAGAASDAGGDGGAVAADDAGEPDPTTNSDAGTTLPDGDAAPPVGAEAPKSVSFGVIVVTFKGAQAAPANARTRDEAATIAKQLAEEAKADFKAAVAKGDKGSMENAGRMPRGMLEPAPEFVLFNLAKGAVSEPVETPRGFWIMQRIE